MSPPVHLATRAFIHLSDIHFRRISDNPFDLDAELRHLVINDAARLATQMGQIDGILVSGDLAYSGHPEEYEVAQRWLAELCRAVGCHLENVYAVPGNHDVDRAAVDGDADLMRLHQELRSCSEDAINARIERWLQDATHGPRAFSPIRHYNHWAMPYQCDVRTDKPRWTRDLHLNDGSVLKITGLNSALISCRDHKSSAPLVLGESLAFLPADPSTINLVLCHHPPSWLRDRRAIEARLNHYARVQLFGHEHQQNIEYMGNTLRLFSGALHPSRNEADWLPMYNLLELAVETGPDTRSLRVDVYARCWDEESRSFVPANYDGAPAEKRTFLLPLGPWVGLPSDAPVLVLSPESGQTAVLSSTRPPAEPAQLVSGGVDSRQEPSKDSGESDGRAPDALPAPQAEHKPSSSRIKATMDPYRRLAFRFLKLSHRQRLQVVQRVHLDHQGDAALGQAAFYEAVFRRASERDQLGELWRVVEEAHGDLASDDTNPFFSRRSSD